jgi:hypothetical protein
VTFPYMYVLCSSLVHPSINLSLLHPSLKWLQQVSMFHIHICIERTSTILCSFPFFLSPELGVNFNSLTLSFGDQNLILIKLNLSIFPHGCAICVLSRKFLWRPKYFLLCFILHTLFFLIFYNSFYNSFIHMCIHCLGHFSTLPPTPSHSPLIPPCFQAEFVLLLSLILLKRK